MILEIRLDQMAEFEAAALQSFEHEMVVYVKTFAPKHCEILKEADVRKTVQLGMKQADAYGLTNRGPIRLYLELMFMFGSHFDTDPQYPWVAQILGMENLDQMPRAERLYAKTLDYLAKAAGPDNEYAKRALRQASLQTLESVSLPREKLETHGLPMLRLNYPEKCRYVGDEPLRLLIAGAAESAGTYAAATDKGLRLFAALAFILGHRFASDPQFPWIEGTLKNERVADASKRVEQLYSKMMTYLHHVLAYHAG